MIMNELIIFNLIKKYIIESKIPKFNNMIFGFKDLIHLFIKLFNNKKFHFVKLSFE